MALKLYEYKNCNTCRKAKKFLDARGISYEQIPIREQPPNKTELKKMLNKVGINRLFNTSSKTYRELNIKEERQTKTTKELLEILTTNGNLIKRPFLIGTEKNKQVHITGFKEVQWRVLFP